MESAIPQHLAVARSRPSRVPEDFVPAYPSFVARTAGTVSQVVMAYLGAAAGPAPEIAPGPDGPRHHDRARQHDTGAVVIAAYWDDVATFERWFTRCREPWLAGRGGRWIEVIKPTVERFETIFGRRSRPEGVAVLAEEFSDEVLEHAYWGGMRDRMPASQTDPLHDPAGFDCERDGERVRVRPRGSVCLIRSGQDWSDCPDDERRTYLERVEPHLQRGMDFLRDEGRDVGCLANRYLTVLDGDGRPTAKTYGLSWWQTLADLERWSESHPTHLAIFGAFMKMATRGSPTRLRLYHEVAVAGPDEQWFEYSGCPDRTGLLDLAGRAPDPVRSPSPPASSA
jgi:aldoxime dehydratase